MHIDLYMHCMIAKYQWAWITDLGTVKTGRKYFIPIT